MFDAIGTVLAWLYELTNNYGLSIMLLTLAIMLLLTPLTLKGTRSMIAMQRLQPEMKKLQNRYKDDRQKLNEEMMKFYKENSINPVGGCLPLLLQAPVFFVLYRVLHGLTNGAPYGQDMGKAFGMAAKDPGAVYQQFGTFQPDHVDATSKLYQDLSGVREMKSFGLDLAKSASEVLSSGVVKALPYVVLLALIAVTAYYQQRQIQGRNPNMASQINPQQQMLMKIMPYFLPIISFTLPAGVTLYFVVSNLFRIGQQGFITRTMYRDEHGQPIETKAVDTSSTDGPSKGFFAQLRETMEAGPKPQPKGGSAKGSSAKGGSAKAGAAKAGSAKGGSAKAGSAKGGAARSGGKSSTARSGTAKSSGRPAAPNRGTSQAKKASGPASSAKNETTSSNGGAEPAPPPTGNRAAAPPSRSAPAPNPNRSQSKKKRR